MTVLIDYIQPLIEWLRANPHWSLFITFFISMLESIAIIGSIVPGSVTMTAIGILAGSGVMPIGETLIAATVGAMVGDNISYAIGYYYRDNLKNIWPFSRYPTWVDYGGDFFKKHGGKSVFIGRFVGPLRSLIPVIAGMMHMKQWRFFIANLLSAILWSIGHVMPGVLIGAAGHELSTEAATKLFLLILLVLAIIWLGSLLIKKVIIKLHLFFRKHLHDFWLLFKGHPTLLYFFKVITPRNESNHYLTVVLLILTLFFLISSLVLVALSIQGEWIKSLNMPIQRLVESFRTPPIDIFFIICTQLTSAITLASLFAGCCIYLLVNKNYKALIYLISLVFSSIAISCLLSQWIYHIRPLGLYRTMPGSAFPNMHLVVASAFYPILVFYNRQNQIILKKLFRSFILIVLSLSGLGYLYLNDYWFTDILASFCIGLSLCFVHWMIFRTNHFSLTKNQLSASLIASLIALILASSGLSTAWHYKKLMHNHTLLHKEHILNKDQWWDQQVSLLPIYKVNRLGTVIGLFNLQYYGDLDVLQRTLEENGWKIYTNSLFEGFLKRMDNQTNTMKMPLLPQLYLNKTPALVMVLRSSSPQFEFILRLWESSYYIENEQSVIWIGSVEVNSYNKANQFSGVPTELNPLSSLHPALEHFVIRQLEIPGTINEDIINPTIYLIKRQ